MVTRPTAFVVGAGASCPYGYPSGAQLVNAIIKGIKISTGGNGKPIASTQESKLLLDMGFERDLLLEFRNELQRSKAFSPDVFLERRTEFIDVGKAAIAAFLLPKENSAQFAPEFGDWYRYLLGTLIEDVGAGGMPSRLTIISYNYERSLEQYLYDGISAFYDPDSTQFHQLFDRLNFIHLHGSFGGLPWQVECDKDSILKFGAPLDAVNVDAAAKRIKIIHEGDANTQEYEYARRALRNAERVCFLGFGYHRKNVERLLYGGWHLDPPLRAHSPIRQFVGTVYGLTSEEVKLRTQQIREGGDRAASHSYSVSSSDCLACLREHAWLLS